MGWPGVLIADDGAPEAHFLKINCHDGSIGGSSSSADGGASADASEVPRMGFSSH